MIHLSDTQLQRMIEHGSTDLDPEVATHLETCNQCREHLEQFSMLFDELDTEEVEVNLSPDFAQKMAVRFKAEHTRVRRKVLALKGLAVAAGVTLMAIGYQIVGADIIGHWLSRYSLMERVSTPQWVISLSTSLQSYEGSYSFVFMTVGVIMLFGSMDKIIGSLKGKKISCL